MDSGLFSGRKIVTGAVLLATGLLVTYWKGDIPPNLLTLMITLFGFFVAGNGLEHYSKMKVASTTSANSQE